MYCKNCGSENNDQARFCIKCGQELGGGVAPAQNQTSPDLKKGKSKTKWLKIGLAALALLLMIICSVRGTVWLGEHGGKSASGGKETEFAEAEADPESLQEAQPGGSTDSSAEGEQDAFTILVYIIGSNLESDSGAATADIIEMSSAVYGDDVNVVLETGGAKTWQNDIIPADRIGRYELKDGYTYTLEELPQASMCQESTLQEFIAWGANAYPADRYGLILWDHGGGVLYGYGVDENFPDDSLYIPFIASAIENAGVHFDFVGFDACMMGCLECAYSLKDCADYMVASEESEAGIGWFSTDWLTFIGEDPYASMEDIGRKMVDGLVNENENNPYWGLEEKKTATLSLIDLSKIEDAYLAWKEFLGLSYEKLNAGGFDVLSKARGNARCYGDNPTGGSYFEMVDMLDYVDECALPGTYDITQDIRSCIVYTNSNISGSNGLSVYAPYHLPNRLDKWAAPMLESIGFDEDYFTYYDAFCATLANGNESIDYDGSLADGVSVPDVTLPDRIKLENVNGRFEYTFFEEQIDTIVKIEMEAGSFIEEEDGSYLVLTNGVGSRFIDLTEDGKLKANNSQMEILAFFSSYEGEDYAGFTFYSGLYDYGTYADGSRYKIQYSPAILNGSESIGILTNIYQDSLGEYSYWVLGYVKEVDSQYADRMVYQFAPGDVISPVMNAYDSEEDPYTTFLVDGEERLVIGEDGLSCGYFRGADGFDDVFKECDYVYRYVITDIYQNLHYTQWVYYEEE